MESSSQRENFPRNARTLQRKPCRTHSCFCVEANKTCNPKLVTTVVGSSHFFPSFAVGSTSKSHSISWHQDKSLHEHACIFTPSLASSLHSCAPMQIYCRRILAGASITRTSLIINMIKNQIMANKRLTRMLLTILFPGKKESSFSASPIWLARTNICR